MRVWHEVHQKAGVVAIRRSAIVMVSVHEPFQVQDGWKGVVVVFTLGGHCHELHTATFSCREDARANAMRLYEEIKRGVQADEFEL